MRYPIVYDRFDTQYMGYGLAVLKEVTDMKVFEKLNGEFTLEFSYPYEPDKAPYLVDDNFVRVEDNLFIMRGTSTVREETKTVTVQCEHIFTELLTEPLIYLDLVDATPQQALDRILAGTRFRGEATGLTGTVTYEFIDTNPAAATQEVMKQLNCEIVPGGLPGPDGKFLVRLVPRRGAERNLQFRYGKNLKSCQRTVDARNVVTRLYVYGRDEIGIEAENGGLPYLDSPRISQYPRPKVGVVTLSDIEYPDELLEAGQKHMKEVENPLVSYEVEVIELKEIPGYEDEAFELGDGVRVLDPEIAVDLRARIVGYERYPLDPERSKVIISNFVETAVDLLSRYERTAQTVEKVTVGDKVNTYWFDGKINALKNMLVASGSFQNAQVIEGQGMLFENTKESSPDFGALYIGPNILAIANSRGVDGKWSWRTFGTGAGFTADEINAGTINAALVNIIAAGGKIEIDGNGIRATNGEKVTFQIGTDGNAEFSGTIKAGVFKTEDGEVLLDARSAAFLKKVIYTEAKISTGKDLVDGTTLMDHELAMMVNGSMKARFSYEDNGSSGKVVMIDFGIMGWKDTYIRADTSLNSLEIKSADRLDLTSKQVNINGQPIVTQDWVQQQIQAALDAHVANYHSTPTP